MPFTHRWSLNARGDLHAFQPSAGVQLSSQVELALTYWSIKSQLANTPAQMTQVS